MNTGRPHMDYCSTCRRHLNGALACPGCGAYAPDIAPLAVAAPAPGAGTGAGMAATAAGAGAATWPTPDHLWHEESSGAEESGEAPQVHPSEDSDALPLAGSSASTGRASRRRQRERWRKTQRRALVATAVALVGGGLTVTSMDRQSTDRTQAASAPDTETMGIAQGPATEAVPASATPADTHRSHRTSSTTGSATANTPHERSAAAPEATPTARTARQDNGTTSLDTVISSAGSQATSTVSDTTGTVADTAASPAPAPAPADGADDTGTAGTSDAPGTSDTSGTGASSTNPSSSEASSPTSPSGLCLLGLVCVS
ncbi:MULTISPECIES: hypothetical protein [unclassified Streptomyces]|uniref:SCO2400 family protein n=1 Tax=unclassified Streptomyces TaxID=2593676 RepID=UPI0036E5EE04